MRRLVLSENLLASVAIILFSIITALLSWLYKASNENNIMQLFRNVKSLTNSIQSRQFIAVYIFILSLINLLFGFVHMLAWGLVVEKAGPYLIGSGIVGTSNQVLLATSTCLCSFLPICKK